MNPYDQIMAVKGFEATKVLLFHHTVDTKHDRLPCYRAKNAKRLLGMVTKGLWMAKYPAPGNDGIIHQHLYQGGEFVRAQWASASDTLYNFLPAEQGVRYVFAPRHLIRMLTDEFHNYPARFDNLAHSLKLEYITINKHKHVLVPADEFRNHFPPEWANRMFVMMDHWFHSLAPEDVPLIDFKDDALHLNATISFDQQFAMCMDVKNIPPNKL